MPIGEKIRLYYDPRGNVIRTVNPDNTEQWVIHGKPNSLDSVAINNSWSFKNYAPTPWESYTYDANDNGQRTHSSLGAISTHWNTPSNSMVDALGRTIKTISRLDNDVSDNEVVMKYTFDILGNQTEIVDTYSRIVFKNIFSLAKQALQTEHIDGGVKHALFDAAGKPVTATDDKGARVFNGYDVISRPKQVWAIDKTSVTPGGGAIIDTSESITLRQYLVYGGPGDEADNLAGKLSQHYDEAGLTEISSYDFKGNPLEKVRRVIKDDEILNVFTTSPLHCYRVNWTGLDESILDSTLYESSIEYDALNRSTRIKYPLDVGVIPIRREVIPAYNKAGALQKITMGGVDYVKHIAYNAKGQKLLVAWGGDNNVMMRFAYDKKTFRLKRVRAEKYEVDSGNDFQFNYLNGNVRYDQAYTYDLVGNVLAVSDKTPDCGIGTDTEQLQRGFEYDALYRLIFASGREMTSQHENYFFTDASPVTPGATAGNCRYYEQDYEYDKLGNITKQKHRVEHNSAEYYTRMFDYITGTNKLDKVRNVANDHTYSEFTYDDNGNTTGNNDDRNYEWDYGDKLRCFYVIASGNITQYTHYLYDAAGNRVKKITRKNSGTLIESTIYIDGAFEHHKKNSEQKNYLQIQGGIEKRIGAFTDDMNPLDAEMDIYHIADYLSSATIRLNKDGGEIDREDYYPYGDTAVRSFEKKRYRFTGKEKDEESGLYHMGARYYQSWCCKFLSIDPKAGKSAHLSGYCYADCNPMVFRDPSGMESEKSSSENSPKTNQVNATDQGKNTGQTQKGNDKQSDNMGTQKAGEKKQREPREFSYNDIGGNELMPGDSYVKGGVRYTLDAHGNWTKSPVKNVVAKNEPKGDKVPNDAPTPEKTAEASKEGKSGTESISKIKAKNEHRPSEVHKDTNSPHTKPIGSSSTKSVNPTSPDAASKSGSSDGKKTETANGVSEQGGESLWDKALEMSEKIGHILHLLKEIYGGAAEQAALAEEALQEIGGFTKAMPLLRVFGVVLFAISGLQHIVKAYKAETGFAKTVNMVKAGIDIGLAYTSGLNMVNPLYVMANALIGGAYVLTDIGTSEIK